MKTRFYPTIKKLSLVLAMAAGFCAVMPTAQASHLQKGAIATATQVSVDQKFLVEAAANNRWTVDIAKLALTSAQSTSVKDFAKHEIESHPALQTQLNRQMVKLGVRAPAAISSAQRKVLQKLSKLRGADFDKAYMTLTIQAHLRDVNSYGQAAQSAQNPEVRQLAAEKVKMMQEHLREAVGILLSL